MACCPSAESGLQGLKLRPDPFEAELDIFQDLARRFPVVKLAQELHCLLLQLASDIFFFEKTTHSERKNVRVGRRGWTGALDVECRIGDC